MNDYTAYPVLMWTLTVVLPSIVVVWAMIPLLAGLTTLKALGADR